MARYEMATLDRLNKLADLTDNAARLTREYWTKDRTPKLGTKAFHRLSDIEFTGHIDPTQQSKTYDRIRKNLKRIDRVNLIRDIYNSIQDAKLTPKSRSCFYLGKVSQ